MDSTAHDALNNRRHSTNNGNSAPPTYVLIVSAVLVLTFALLAANFGDAPSVASAQTTPALVDYDIDDDGYIDIRTHSQMRVLNEDRNSDGVPDSGRNAGVWNAAYPNRMTGMGCPLTDHDSDPMTADEPTCVGYELLNEIDFNGTPAFYPIAWDGDAWSFGGTWNGRLKGNGYRLINMTYEDCCDGSFGMISRLGPQGRIEGLGLWNARIRSWQLTGSMVGNLQGTIIGSYYFSLHPHRATGGDSIGGMVGVVDGTIVNSFGRGYARRIGQRAGGLAARLNSGGTCRNSFFSGFIPPYNRERALLFDTYTSGGTITGCYGDTTTDSQTSNVISYSAPSQAQTLYGRTFAQLAAPTAYDMPMTGNPYSTWNTDEDGDGEPDDVWDFGDETQLPVLKGYGHDVAFPIPLPLWRLEHTVNLCERTLAVANEFIKHLQDDVFRPGSGVTEVPPAVASLEPCEDENDTQEVSVQYLRDLVYTTPDHPFRLDPERTDPPSPKITELDDQDLAYAWWVSHIDLSGNALTTMPPRLFSFVHLRQLDLSDNAITSLHADTFASDRVLSAADRESSYLFVNLDGNRLTEAGLPDRVFDSLSQMNSLTIRSNALAGINTRWFERLANIGRRPAGDSNILPNLGLHLDGNPITEHYYSQRAFGDLKFDETEYSGENPGAALLTAITSRLEAFGTDTTNMLVATTDYLVGGTIRTTGCPAGLTQGPPGTVDINGDPVQCEFSAHWTPPASASTVTVAFPTAPAAVTGQGSIRITFMHTSTPMVETGMTAAPVTGYQIRFRPRPTDPSEPWTQQWRSVPVDVSTDGEKTLVIDRLEADTVYEFQMRPLSAAGPGPASSFSQGTRLRLPVVSTIKPTIREISVQAGQQVRLEVDVYSRQDTVRNDLADADGAKVVFQWSESPSSGGSFGSPSTDRRVVYTAPNLPGTYTVLAEAQPEGACASHHSSRFGLTEADRAPCIATFTIRVSRAPGTAEPPPDPVNPAGLIPSSLTDNDGVAYAVFTPVDGGTFTGEGITVTAIKGAVPDGQLLGVSATASSIPVPAPIPGARMTLAGSYYEVNGVQRNGEAPVSGYALDDPISACLPLPDMFRSDISDVVVVNRNPSNGTLGILSSKVRQTDSGLVICGSIGTLPATVAAARLGIVEATPEPPQEPGIDDLSVGAVTPGAGAAVWAMVIGAMMLAAVVGIAIRRRPVGTHRDASAAPNQHRANC